MIEELPVLETEVIEPDGVDLSLYRRIGEEVTRVVRHKLGMLYVKEINALKDNMQLPSEGQKSGVTQRVEKRAFRQELGDCGFMPALRYMICRRLGG